MNKNGKSLAKFKFCVMVMVSVLFYRVAIEFRDEYAK